jgi:hypothetical protein
LASFFSGPRAAPERPLPPEGPSRRPRGGPLFLSLSRGMKGLHLSLEAEFWLSGAEWGSQIDNAR